MISKGYQLCQMSGNTYIFKRLQKLAEKWPALLHVDQLHLLFRKDWQVGGQFFSDVIFKIAKMLSLESYPIQKSHHRS